MLAFEDLLEAAHVLPQRHVLPRDAREHLAHVHGLAEEPFHAPRPCHGLLVLVRKLLDAEDGDDVLQVLVPLQHPLHAARDVEVLLPHDVRIEDARRRRQRVHRRVDRLLEDAAVERDDGVEVAERRRDARVGVVVGRHVDRLERRDGPLLRRRDPLFQLTHLRGQRRLVAHGRRHAAEERRHFHSGQRVAVDVVDEEQHVLAGLVAEVLRHRQAGEGDAEAHAGRLVHLAEDEHRLVEHARLFHLDPEVVALAGALAHAGEDGDAGVLRRDVADQLLDEHGLADAGASEQADFAAAHQRRDQVDDLDARLEHLDLRLLLLERRRLAVDRGDALLTDVAALVERLAEHVEEAAQRLRPDRHRDRRAGIDDDGAAAQSVGRVHRQAAHPVVSQVLLDLGDDRAAIGGDLDGVEQGRQIAGRELDVHDRPDHLRYPAPGCDVRCHMLPPPRIRRSSLRHHRRCRAVPW